MTTKSSMKSKPSIPASTKGLTLIEVLIAAAVGALMVSAAFGIASSNRRLLSTDQARTTVNQNLRSAADIIGNDVRISGERLSGFFSNNLIGNSDVAVSAVELIDGKELVLRRNLIDSSLPLCEDNAEKGEQSLVVASTTNIGSINIQNISQCAVLSSDGDDIPDNLQAWLDYSRTYLAKTGSKPRAFIYLPNGNKGDYFTIEGFARRGSRNFPYFSILTGGARREHVYYGVNQPYMLMLEERRYVLNDEGILQLILNGDSDNPINLVNDIEDFQARVIMPDGTARTNFAVQGSATASEDNWTTIQAVEITVTGKSEVLGKESSRTFSARYLPRNVLSN